MILKNNQIKESGQYVYRKKDNVHWNNPVWYNEETNMMRESAANMNKILRPDNWYKPVTHQFRSELYPKGALNAPPKGGMDLTKVRDEHTRLCDCLEAMLMIEGETPRVQRMINHVERLDRWISIMNSESYIRRTSRKHYEIRQTA